MSNPYLQDHEQHTQPHQPVQQSANRPISGSVAGQHVRLQQPVAPNYRRSHPRYWGRTRGCLALMFVGSLLSVLFCVGTLALYVLFPPPSVDILVMGLDSRGSEGVVTRTDSILVVGVNPARFDVNVLSIPRDLFVDVPGYGMQRINTVNVLAESQQSGTGPILLSQSIGQNFGIGIDRYARLDFQAFTAVVDAIGGINLNVPYAITDYQYPTPDYGIMEVHFEPGWQHLNGERALIYARTRHADDDYRRAERQQLVLGAIARKLANPLYWPAALNALNRNIETNLTIQDMLWLSPTVILNRGNFQQLVVNREYILAGEGYSVPNYERLRPWIAEHFD